MFDKIRLLQGFGVKEKSLRKFMKAASTVLIFIIFSCGFEKSNDESAAVELPDVVQRNYNHYIYKGTRLFLEAKIDIGRTYEKRKATDCEVISARVYNSKGELATLISADLGEIDSRRSILKFINNVYIERFEDKVILRTDELSINYNENTMITEKKVIITKEDGSILIADGMNSDLSAQTTTFYNMDLTYYYEDEDE